MNILYLHTHDAGRCFQPYGYPVRNPHLMSFAKEATTFRSAFCAAPTCSPSRAALLTGSSPHSCGMFGLAHHGFNGGFSLPDYSRHLVQYLNRYGYETVLCGIQHEACDEEEIGYRRKLNDVQHTSLFGRTDYKEQIGGWDIHNANLCASYLKERTNKEPFFLSFGMYATHRPYPVRNPEIHPDFVSVPSGQPDTPAVREDTAELHTALEITDCAVGIVLQALREAGLENDTVVLFTTDHGLPLPGHKCNLTDDGIAVAMMLGFPHNPMKGKVSDALVSQIDVFPTLCELARLPCPEWVEGKSLLPVLREGKEIHEAVFAEINYHGMPEPARCVRTQRYQYIRHYAGEKTVETGNCDPSPSKQQKMNCGWQNWEQPAEELYDLTLDPQEKVNLAEKPEYQEIREYMSSLLASWMQETGDCLPDSFPARPQTQDPVFSVFEGDYHTELENMMKLYMA